MQFCLFCDSFEQYSQDIPPPPAYVLQNGFSTILMRKSWHLLKVVQSTRLRNIIEQTFGMGKRQFQIFVKPPEYSQATRLDIVYAATGLHNFIKSHPGKKEGMYYMTTDVPDDEGNDGGVPIMQSSSTQMNGPRDRLAG